MDQTLIAAEALVGVLERRVGQHGVKVHVNGTQVGVFRQVEPNAIVAGRFRRAGEQTHASAHGHAGVGIIECRGINADGRQYPANGSSVELGLRRLNTDAVDRG